jgi:hypothetical protein
MSHDESEMSRSMGVIRAAARDVVIMDDSLQAALCPVGNTPPPSQNYITRDVSANETTPLAVRLFGTQHQVLRHEAATGRCRVLTVDGSGEMRDVVQGQRR